MAARVTVSHEEDATEFHAAGGRASVRSGLDVRAEITYAPMQAYEALAAVDRLSVSLRRQIAEAAKGAEL